MMLSVVIPAYNERESLPKILAKVIKALPHVTKEIIVVDDCSTDGTRLWLSHEIGEAPRMVALDETGALVIADPADPVQAPSAQIRALFHTTNQGKGAALRTGFKACSGAVLVVQDADLEYDPADWDRFWPLFDQDIADVVYGTRFLSSAPHRCLYYHHYFANKIISLIFSILYNQILTDLEVCYKMFRKDVLNILTLRSNDFGFEIEFSSNVVLHRRLRIYELGIAYYGRTYNEGKKINWRDGVKALWYLIQFRFT